MNTLATPAAPAVPAVFERSPGYWQTVARRLLRDKVALGAGGVILLLLAMAVLGAAVAPADPYQSSMLNRLKPIGFEGNPLGEFPRSDVEAER